MPNPHVIDSYLVSLGFDVDSVGQLRYAGALKDVVGLTNNSYLSMAKRAIEFQIASTGAFAAIGTATLGLADRVSQADQSYRLLALHMFTSVPVARSLKVALDALGQPLENVMWDPELAKRFHQLIADQQIMTQQLGPDFEQNMVKIRDLRFEFTRLGVETQYLSMGLVNQLAEHFGLNLDDLTTKFRHLNDYIRDHGGEIDAWISNRLQPILKDAQDVFSTAGDALEQFTTDYIHFVGIVSGDKRLSDAPLTFDNLSAAILKTSDALATALENMFKFEKNMALLFDAADQAMGGNISAAVADLKQMEPIRLPNTLSHQGHRLIFRAFQSLFASGKNVDLVTLTDYLHHSGELDRAGGGSYLSQLLDGVPRVSNIDHYSSIVRDDASLPTAMR